MNRREFLSRIGHFELIHSAANRDAELAIDTEWMRLYRGTSGELLNDARFVGLVERSFAGVSLKHRNGAPVCDLIHLAVTGSPSDVVLDQGRYLIATMKPQSIDCPAIFVWIDAGTAAADPNRRLFMLGAIDQAEEGRELWVLSTRHLHEGLRTSTLRIPRSLKHNFKQWFRGQAAFYHNVDFCNWISRERENNWVLLRSRVRWSEENIHLGFGRTYHGKSL